MNQDIKNIFSDLSHDLKNDFVIIRAAAGSIKKHSHTPDIVEKKLNAINQALDQAIAHLENARVILTNDEGHRL